MFKFRRHTSFLELSRFADQTLGRKERQRVQAHLHECARCRERLSFIRELGQAARQIHHPRPPNELLAEILAKRAAGERVILPAAAPSFSRRRRPMLVGMVLTAGLLAMAAGLALFPSNATAGASELRFIPPQPRPGLIVSVEYRPSSLLADDEVLRLRGRYRTASDGPVRGVLGLDIAAELRREADGLFRGAVRLPSSAVYAVFAVEDPDGRRLDSNGGRLWELLVHDDTDRPFFAALRQRFHVLEHRNWLAATGTAREMTALYPERAEGWLFLLSHERLVVDSAAMDSLNESHRSEFLRLERALLQLPNPEADELAALKHYARLLGERDSETRLDHRLRAEHPSHTESIRG
ncbi:MAG: anti-sigma factor family protein, partial [Gemmatimonadota bacterium]